MQSNTVDLISMGLIALTSGQKEQARQYLSRVVRVEPDNSHGWLYLAATLPRDQAIQALKRVIVLQPDNCQALRGLEKLSQQKNPASMLALEDIWSLEVDKTDDLTALFGQEQATARIVFSPAEADYIGEDMTTRFGGDSPRPSATPPNATPPKAETPPRPAPPAEKPFSFPKMIQPLSTVPYHLQPKPLETSYSSGLSDLRMRLCAVVMVVVILMMGFGVLYYLQ